MIRHLDMHRMGAGGPRLEAADDGKAEHGVIEPAANGRRLTRPQLALIVAAEIDRRLHDPQFRLGVVADALGVSPRSVQRAMAWRGVTFSDALRERRLERARRMLPSSELTIEQIASQCGFIELSSFYRAFKARYGCAPGAFRRAAQGAGAAAPRDESRADYLGAERPVADGLRPEPTRGAQNRAERMAGARAGLVRVAARHAPVIDRS